MNIKKLFCSHKRVEVIRWHPNVVTEDMKGKELFRDVHNVANFVRCVCCHHIFETAQKNHLYETGNQGGMK